MVAGLYVRALRALPAAALKQLCEEHGVATEETAAHDELVDQLLPLSDAAQLVLPVSCESRCAEVRDAVNIIFLDVDGVLTCDDDGGEECVYVPWPGSTRGSTLDEACMRRLVELCGSSSARIVLSSNWRMSLTLTAELWDALVAAGLPADALLGQTPVLEAGLGRSAEILEWVRQHRSIVRQFVVLDDMPMSCDELAGHFVWIDGDLGLRDGDVARALSMLTIL